MWFISYLWCFRDCTFLLLCRDMTLLMDFFSLICFNDHSVNMLVQDFLLTQPRSIFCVKQKHILYVFLSGFVAFRQLYAEKKRIRTKFKNPPLLSFTHCNIMVLNRLTWFGGISGTRSDYGMSPCVLLNEPLLSFQTPPQY